MSLLQAPPSLLGIPLSGLGGVGMPSFRGVREEGKATVPPLGSRLPLTSAILSSFLFLWQRDAGGDEGVSSLPHSG